MVSDAMTQPQLVVLALDLGTTSIKAARYAGAGRLGEVVSLPAPAVTVSGDRYESDALAYAQTAEQVLAHFDHVLHGAVLGMCSQRSSFLIWDRANGSPVTPLISWQDKRGQPSCDALRDQQSRLRELTGLPLTPYYLAPKLRELLRHHPHWSERLVSGEWCVGMLDSFLIWRWTSGRSFVTDASMAARSLLMQASTLQWSAQLLALFGLPDKLMPEIVPSCAINLPLDNGLTLMASVGDQSAALLAGGDLSPDEVIVNLGTGCFVVRALPAGCREALPGYLRTLVYQGPQREGYFALEGTLNSTAAALAPYPVADCTVDDLAREAIFALAEPSGLGAPYFVAGRLPSCFSDPAQPGLGVQFSAPVDRLSPHRVATLLLEAIIFRVAAIVEDFAQLGAVERVFLSGGLAELAVLREGIAACVPCPVYRLVQNESSLLGAAMLAAGMAAGSQRQGELVPAPAHAPRIREKYRRWRLWLDQRLPRRSPS